MAIGKSAIGIVLACAAWAQEFPVRHDHLRKFCEGTLRIDENGIRYEGPKGHAWTWPYSDIQQLTLYPGEIRILSYKDASNWKLGKDAVYTFQGKFPVEELRQQWSAKLDQRFVAAVAAPGVSGRAFPAKELGLMKGTQGVLTFGEDAVVYDTTRNARTWRYQDIQYLSNAGPFELTITTLEKQFRFQLKKAIDESTYNQLWLEIEKKNGRIQ